MSKSLENKHSSGKVHLNLTSKLSHVRTCNMLPSIRPARPGQLQRTFAARLEIFIGDQARDSHVTTEVVDKKEAAGRELRRRRNAMSTS